MPTVHPKIDNPVSKNVIVQNITELQNLRSIFYYRVWSQPNMGKGPKHNIAKPRSNGIFKVAGQKFKNEKKGKAKEVTSNIKQVSLF